MRRRFFELMFTFAIAMLLCSPIHAQAGNFVLPSNTGFIGFLSAQGKQPVATGCTIVSGSTDAAGKCSTTATSGTIVFAKTDLVNPPFCVVSDGSGGTPTYTVTATQITLVTITSAHVLFYWCAEQAGQ